MHVEVDCQKGANVLLKLNFVDFSMIILFLMLVWLFHIEVHTHSADVFPQFRDFVF